jgi:drug/metabolite transporter (DMT)-like permease
MYITGRSVVVTAATIFSPLTFAKAIIVVKDGDSQLQRWSSFIGIITAIIGNILISIALNVQRYAHIRLHKKRQKRRERSKSLARSMKNCYGATVSNGNGARQERIADEEERDPLIQSYHSADSQSTICPEDQTIREESYLKSPYWWAGILLMTIGETGNFLAYGFAPASIVSPLGVVALISNCVIAPIMLKEQFRWRDFWGVVVAVSGAVTVVLSAKHQEKKLGPHEVMGAITTMAFEIYMGTTIALISALMWASPKYGSRTILLDLGLVGLFGKRLERH